MPEHVAGMYMSDPSAGCSSTAGVEAETPNQMGVILAAADRPGISKRRTPTPTHAPTVAPTAVPTATQVPPTPVPGATQVPTAVPTATQVPTAVPTATRVPPTPVPAATQVPPTPVPGPPGSVPACVHDVTKWHGLVERNADNTIRCTYGHEHGADPRVLDSLFGPLAQQISYAWATVSSSGVSENSDTPILVTSDGRSIVGGKHRFYKWEVITAAQLQARRGKSCSSVNTPYSIDNARMEVHADGNAGAAIRFHSFTVDAELCDPNNSAYKGTVKLGGHFDYGHLMYTKPDGSGDAIIPLPDDPGPGYTSFRKIHGATTDRSQNGFRGDFTWYGSHGLVSDGIREEDWGPVDPNNPTGPVQFYGATGDASNPTYNHGQGVSLDLLQINVPDPSRFGVKPRTDGTYDWSGHLDRSGHVVQCSTPDVDCIPVVFQNVMPGRFQISAEDPPMWDMTNFDVVDPSTGKSLITFVN
jgi:hypothetical protein